MPSLRASSSLPAIEEDRGRYRWVHFRVAEREIGEGLKVVSRQDHEVAVVLLDDGSTAVVNRDCRIDGEADRRVEGRRAIGEPSAAGPAPVRPDFELRTTVQSHTCKNKWLVKTVPGRGLFIRTWIYR